MIKELIFLPIFVGVATYVYFNLLRIIERRRLYFLLIRTRNLNKKVIIMTNQNDKDWTRHSELVLQSLVDIKSDINDIKSDISKLKVKVGQLEVRSGFYGFIGGALAMIPTIIVWIFSHK